MTSSSPHVVLWLSICFWVSLATAAAEQQIVELWPEGVPGLKPDAGPEIEENGRFSNVHQPTLTIYAPDHGAANGTAVIFAAGGGYVRVAIGAKGGEITRWLNSLGVTVFVLKYRHDDYGQPAPLQDALRAVRLVRTRAAEWGVRPDRIGMVGGSAGGHLTATAGTLFDAPEGRTGARLDAVSGRPDFLVLIFPVITMQAPHAHDVSRRSLLGPAPDDELIRRWSAELQVTSATPPTFLVHSSEDRVVAVENSLLLYAAMRQAGASIEMHLYPRGPHGSGMDAKLGPTSDCLACANVGCVSTAGCRESGAARRPGPHFTAAQTRCTSSLSSIA
jgi:acetyl esterase/lipase